MKPKFIIISLLILLFSCSRNVEGLYLNIAESLLSVKPDSSLVILKSITPENLHSSAQKAKYALLLSAALDKNYIDVQSDSLISIATKYYDQQGSVKEQMMAWYYDGIVKKNKHVYAPAVVSFEKAAKNAEIIKDSHFLGLIYRNIAASFNQSYNIESAIEYMQKAIACFQITPSDSLYLQYAKCSLATCYLNNNDYNLAEATIQDIDSSFSINLKVIIDTYKAYLKIMKDKDYEDGISKYKEISPRFLTHQDYSAIALAYNHLNQTDLSLANLNNAYNKAVSRTDSSYVDFTKSKILVERGKVLDAYYLLDYATSVQDSLTRSVLSESVSSAQRDYFKKEAETETEKRADLRRQSIVAGIIGILTALLVIIMLVLRSWKKEQWLKELMAKEAINSQNISLLSKENAFLLSTHYSERIRYIDNISCEYYSADNKTQRDLVFKQFKDYVGDLRDDASFYKSIEEDLNKYCNDIMHKLRSQVPQIKGLNLKTITLFFAGLSYETVAIILHAQSISSLKMQRTRFRKTIEESNAADKQFLLDMLEMKRRPTRKTNE